MPVIRAETIGPVTLVLGDCLIGAELTDLVPPGSAAAIITDPPYCSGGFTEASRRTAKSMGVKSEALGWFEGDNMTTLGLQFLLRAIAIDSWTMLRKGGTLSLFMDWRMIPAIAPAIESARLRWQQLVVWDKKSAGLGNGFRAQHETLLHFAKGVPLYYGARNGNVIQNGRPRSADRAHPTEKPVDLLAKIIDTVAEPGSLIVDWFGGSGSTAVAAIASGRRCVSFEVDPVFHERAVERCRAELGKGRIFAAADTFEQGALEVGAEPAEIVDLTSSAGSAPARVECPDCGGDGDGAWIEGEGTVQCTRCNGSGTVEPDSTDDLDQPYASRSMRTDQPSPASDNRGELESAAEFERLTRAAIEEQTLTLDNPGPDVDKAAAKTCEFASIPVEKSEVAIGIAGAPLDSLAAAVAGDAVDALSDDQFEAVLRGEPGAVGELVAQVGEAFAAYVAPESAFAFEPKCARCRGEGWIRGDTGAAEDCPRCGGSGDAGLQDRCPDGHVNTVCPSCNGRASEGVDRCSLCSGFGQVNFYAIPEAQAPRTCMRTGQGLLCWSRLCAAAGRCSRTEAPIEAGALL